MLPVAVIHHHFEAPVDYVSRLAVANGFTSLQQFLEHTDVSARALVACDEGAISKVSDWSGLLASELNRWNVEGTGLGGTWRMGSATLSKDMRIGRRFRFCAKCVIDDRQNGSGRTAARAYRRVWWNVRSILGCDVHGCELTDVPVNADVDLHDFNCFINKHLPLVDEAANTAPRSRQPSLDGFLVARIAGELEEGFTQVLDAHVVVEFCRYLGDFLRLHEIHEHLDDELTSAECGFRIVRNGQTELRRVLMETIDRERPTAEVGGFLGPMVHWLRRNIDKTAYQPVIDFVQDVMQRNMPFGEGQVIFRPVGKRFLHSVNSAHSEFGMSKERIRALVVANDPGFRDGLPDASSYFGAEKFDPILQAATETLTSIEVAKVLGLREERVRDLLDAEILPQVEKRSDGTRNYSRIRKCDVDGFTERLTECLMEVIEDTAMLTLSEASRTWGRPFHVLVAMVLDKSLQAFVIEGTDHVLTRVRVKPDGLNIDAGRLAGGTKELMRLKEVELVIGSTTATVSELIEREYLRVRVERRETGRSAKFVLRQSLLEFDQKYISLSAITKCRQGFRAKIKEELDALKIAPIYEPTGFNARFYDRSELERNGFSF